MKLNFVQKVSKESSGIVANIAELALAKNEIDQLMDIFHDQHSTNPELFKKMLGNEIYIKYLEIVNFK